MGNRNNDVRLPGRDISSPPPDNQAYDQTPAPPLAKAADQMKRITVYLPTELWVYLKQRATDESAVPGKGSTNVSRILTQLVEDDRIKRHKAAQRRAS